MQVRAPAPNGKNPYAGPGGGAPTGKEGLGLEVVTSSLFDRMEW